MNKEVYLIYFDDEDSGDGENWSVFYCEPEVYDDPILAQNRLDELDKITDGRIAHLVKAKLNTKTF